MRTGRFRFLRPGVLLLTLALVGIVPAPAATEAAWVVTAPTTSDRLVGRLPPPTISKCELRPGEGILAPPSGIIVTWRLPEGFAMSDLSGVEVLGGTSGVTLQGLTDFNLRGNTTLPDAGGVMTTTIPSRTLNTILNLGSTSQFTFRASKGTKDTNTYWTSEASVRVTSNLLTLRSCSPIQA